MAVNTLRPKKNPSPKSKPSAFGPEISLNAKKRELSVSALPTLNNAGTDTPFVPTFVVDRACVEAGQ